jgi:hypothetical protein
MSNRIAELSKRYQVRIDGVTQEVADKLDISMALNMEEFVTFQNKQAMAFASGKLSQSEATWIYRKLGGEVFSGDWPKATTLADKTAITQLMSELLGVYPGACPKP